ncbi:hypothetical protein [Pedococcus sp. P5_B7]
MTVEPSRDAARHVRRAALLLALASLPSVVATALERGWVPESGMTRWMFDSDFVLLGICLTLGLAIAAWRSSLAAMNARPAGSVASPMSSVVFLLSVLVTIATALVAIGLLLLN